MTAVEQDAVHILLSLDPVQLDAALVLIAAAYRDALIAEANLRSVRQLHDRAVLNLQAAEASLT